MVLDEMPEWLDERGFDASRRALWGWSMGGRGVLRMAEVEPGWARAVAAFAPAISEGDDVFANADALEGTPLGFWVGTDDSFYEPGPGAGRRSFRRSRRSTRPAPVGTPASTGTTRPSRPSPSWRPTWAQ